MLRGPVFQGARAIQFPRVRGTYVLILRLERLHRIQVGRLGCFRFPVGWFAYVGSAFGPGGLRGRLGHHLNPAAPNRWHIDYLRKVATLDQVWLASGEEVQEHAWARLLREGMKGEIPVPGFGSSDCRCEAHLFRFGDRPSWHTFRALLPHGFPVENSVFRSGPDVEMGKEDPVRFFLEQEGKPVRRGIGCRKGSLRKESSLP